jgi:primosomal protein N' (replication factor Y)
MEELTAPTCVDVVVDVGASRLEGAFTYLTGSLSPAIGARVRVSFGGRSVGGWVVSAPAIAANAMALRPIESVDDASEPLDAAAVRLARWMYRRYACTFREAIGAIAARGTVRAGGVSFRFAKSPPDGDAVAATIHRRFGDKHFTSVAARRAVRSAGQAIDLGGVLRELDRLTRAGIVARASAQKSKTTAPRRVWLVRAANLSMAKGPAQRRIAEVLKTEPAGLTLSETSRRAATTSAVVRRAAHGGVCSIEELREGARPAVLQPTIATSEQQAAIEAIDSATRRGGSAVLLHGVTGSGKTFVYARAIERLRAGGGRAVVLVPEISLTPQTAGRFSVLYGAGVGVLHSGLSDGERARVWEDARNGALDVVVGARSAVFAPLPDLRLIVLDEEHEASYKQDVAPRYDTAAVALERMREVGGTVVLGSATPSLESYWAAKSQEISYVRLSQRATSAPLPPVEIVDMTADVGPRGRRPLGPALVSAIENALSRREKVMLFVNRRGYAGLLLCRACGFAPKCRRCAISLVVHTADGSMRCHVCGDAYRVATRCPKCRSEDLKPFGFGTQRVEEEVRGLFPGAGVVRMDSDTTTVRGSHGRLLDAFGSDADILVGTQMIAKGLDFPTVTVVGVVSADIDLNRPDFRASERTFSLLTQVAGRAGRAAPGARVVVQTYSPEHYAIKLAARHDYESFAAKELALRRELRYPPFGRLAYLAISGVDASNVADQSAHLAQALRMEARGVEVLGPAPEPLPKARGAYRMRIALKTDDEAMLLEACALAKAVKLNSGARLSVIVDPR